MTDRKKTETGYQFGTFKGVFTPSILTILGVIMYLRLGWVLGNLGLGRTLVVVTLASAITFLTGVSLAALATNMRIGGGGAYYIISRSLGLESGTAVGLPLYLAQAHGIAFYVSGFAEALVATYPLWPPLAVRVGTLCLLALVTFFSANLALRVQYLVMGVIAFSLVSFFAGGGPPAAAVGEWPAAPARLGFWPVFAVFFPAVTGIEAGIAMSGDLKNPARSLPLGTIAAVLTGYAVYVAIPVTLAFAVHDRRLLLTDPLIMATTARWGKAVLFGIWAASLSSAIGSLLGAPRTLQALARDGVLPAALGRGYGKGNDPRLAAAVSFLVALVAVVFGGINLIAPVLSMFFLTSYGLLNLSAGLEELISSPSWRPTFRVPAWVSLLGFFACLATMLMINAGATLIAGTVSAAVYLLMKKRSLRARWGDMRFGILMFGAREILYRMAGQRHDERTWKPNILAFSGSPLGRWYLIELAQAIAQGKSFLTVATIIPEAWSAERAEGITESVRGHLRRHNVQAFIKTMAADEPLVGAQHLIRLYGFGPVVPNTILIGETEKVDNFVEFSRLVQLVHRTRRNLIVIRRGPDAEHDMTWSGPERRAAPREEDGDQRIDVWWKGKAENLGFMLALVMLLRRSPAWRSATLVIKMIVKREAERDEALQRVAGFAKKERLKARVEIIVQESGNAFAAMRSSSKDARLVFLGVRPPGEHESAEEYSCYYAEVLGQTEGLPPTALVMAAEQVDFWRLFESAEEVV